MLRRNQLSEIKDLLKRIRELEIKTKGLVDGMMTGGYKSKIRGRGIEFSEVREYVLEMMCAILTGMLLLARTNYM